MQIAVIGNPRSRQEGLGQFLSATPVADFMASNQCLLIPGGRLVGIIPHSVCRAPETSL